MENVPTVKDETLPFVLMDRLDDVLIIEELEGRMPDILTYHYNDGKQEVWGLSKGGIDECTNELSKKGEVIRELELVFTDGKDEAFFQVKAGRYAVKNDGTEILLDTKIGVKRQPKKHPRGSDNPFWYEQGSIKACRNAAFRLIPKAITQAVIEYAKQHSKVKEVEVKPEDNPPNPPQENKPQTQSSKTSDSTGCISKAQVSRFWAIAKATGANNDTIKNWLIEKYHIDHTDQIPYKQYEEICKKVKEDLSIPNS